MTLLVIGPIPTKQGSAQAHVKFCTKVKKKIRHTSIDGEGLWRQHIRKRCGILRAQSYGLIAPVLLLLSVDSRCYNHVTAPSKEEAPALGQLWLALTLNACVYNQLVHPQCHLPGSMIKVGKGSGERAISVNVRGESNDRTALDMWKINMRTSPICLFQALQLRTLRSLLRGPLFCSQHQQDFNTPETGLQQIGRFWTEAPLYGAEASQLQGTDAEVNMAVCHLEQM